VLPVSLAPWWPETAARLPTWSADPHLIGFWQSLVLLVWVGGSVLLLRRLLRQAWRPWLLVSLVPLALGLGSRWLVGDGVGGGRPPCSGGRCHNGIPRHSHVYVKQVVLLSAPDRHAESTPQPQPGLGSSLSLDEPFTSAAFAASLGMAAPNTTG